MFKRFLVPLDGSSLAEQVLPFAIYLAKQLQATLILFHVVEKDAPDEVHKQHHIREVSEARTYLKGIADRVSAGGLTILQDVHEVQEVGVAQTITNHAVELETDLVILCAHGNGGLRDMIFGSIAQQVIRHGKIPVLFIRPEFVTDPITKPIRKILIPLDGLKAHEVAIPIAVYLAEECKAEIRLLTVVPTSETLPIKKAITTRVSPRAVTLSLDITAQQAGEYLQSITKEISAKGLPISGNVERGNILSKLQEIISADDIDLVVMATHGTNVLDAHWEGSLTPRFLPKTPVPVILVCGDKQNNSS